MWLLLRNKLKTSCFLHSIIWFLKKIVLCVMLAGKHINHIYNLCTQTKIVCDIIKERTHSQNDYFDNISTGFWLQNTSYAKHHCIASLITAASWFIWKSRCNIIFKGYLRDPHQIALQAFDHVHEFNKSACYQREIFLLNHFNTNSADFYLFTDGSWVHSNHFIGVGFVIINSNQKILVAGCIIIEVRSALEAEVGAVEIALKVAETWGFRICSIFADCRYLQQVFDHNNNDISWRCR